MPTNLYGPGDNYHPENSHVIPALIRRFHEAKLTNAPEVVIWGTGTPRREFLYVDDMAAASVFVMALDKKIYDRHTEPMQNLINVGYSSDQTIQDLASVIAKEVGFRGLIKFDTSRPDGSPKKLLDSSLIRSLGWSALVNLEEGIKITYRNFKKLQ